MVGQFKIQSSNKDLRLRILIDNLLGLLHLISLSIIKLILCLDNNIWVWFVYMNQWILWLHWIELWRRLPLHWVKSLLLSCHVLPVHWVLLTTHATTHAHRILPLGFHKVICALYVDSLLVDEMTFISIGIYANKPHLIFLGLVLIFELHFDEAKSSTSSCCTVSHDNGISHYSECLEIFDKV